MNRIAKRFKLRASAVALLSATSAMLVPAMAQSGTPASEQVEQVTVTGTSIRGIAPIGSNVIAIGAGDIAAAGVTGVTDALASVPALTFFGSSGRAVTTARTGGVGAGIGIHDFGGASTKGTLVIIDGHRAVESGQWNFYVDPNQIPVNMLERVEVVADGASAIYGSDAVAGVVNFITRSHFEGLQLQAQGSIANGITNELTSLLLGHSWDSGSFVFGASYTHYGMLKNVNRPYLDPLQQAQRAAANGVTGPNTSNFGNFFCNPASLQPAGQLLIYTSPTSGNAVTNIGDNQPCSQFAYGSLLPTDYRQNAMLKIQQSLGPRLNFSADMTYFHKADSQIISRGTLQGTAFQTGAQANPFYVSPAGYTGTATSETVRYDFNQLLGPGASNIGGVDMIAANAKLDYNVDDNWVVSLSLATGRNDQLLDSFGVVDGAAALLALNGTGQQSGSTTATAIPGYNAPSTNLPLTAANALDVWNPASSNRTSQAVKTALMNGKGTSHAYYSTTDWRLSTNGTLFTTRAGAVKLAAGVEQFNHSIQQIGTAPGLAAPASVDSTFYSYNFGRGNFAAYLEAVIPLVGPDMHVPFIQKFEIDVAGRHDYFSGGIGSTDNPKIGFSWQVNDDVRVRGGASTSFVAPILPIVGSNVEGLANFDSAAGSIGLAFLPVKYFPQVTQFGIPGCTAASVTCSITSLQGIKNTVGGANLIPAQGRTWSIGLDFTPSWLQGFTSSVTYWSNSLKNGLTSPGNAIVVTSPTLAHEVTLFPNCATQADIARLVVSPKGYPTPQTSSYPACVQAISQSINDTFLWMWVQGVDLQFDYSLETDLGTFGVGSNLSELVKFDTAYTYRVKPTDTQIFSVLNTQGINQGFPALGTTMRTHFNWSLGPVSTSLFVNYTGAYHNLTDAAKTPLVNNQFDVYSGAGGDHVKAAVTFDVHASYDFDGGILGDDTISLTVDNIFDRQPSFYNSALGYDASIGSPIGRSVSLDLKAKF